ncbi:hypothetical protein [Microbacterium sp. NIBRBAC000506063]|uniref:hypothetical protein n=1 Tax=Microbacterium sp. NIBRBAC000506063 TaxID=2734618 RepID=UPI001BB4BDA0|nr:hypothetical protein [Microbacterium sp. NIBRBAC000506063]QTV80563.1 hypothetical protein KAE78_06830 [Microbacterium sp. NIBRBAC000506063]
MSRVSFALLRGALAAVYAVLKVFTRVDPRKVVFLSRRMDDVPPDFAMLIEELRRRNPRVNVATMAVLVKGDRSETGRFAPC